MNDEVIEKARREEERTKAIILAGNPQLYMKLWPEGQEDDDVEWETPETEDELADFIREFEQGAARDPSV